MAIMTVNTQKLFKYLEKMENVPNRNILLVGKHGIGKSEILTKFHEDRGRKVVTVFLGQMADQGDLLGLPRPNEAINRMSYLRPDWWPEDNQPIVLFLDELNRARPEILNVVMDLALNKKLGGKSLPKGSRIVAAVNGGMEYNITDLDPALQSRFAMVEFKPTVEEWLEWAMSKALDQRVVDFIRDNKTLLDGTAETSAGGLNKTPDRRAWKDVCDLVKGQEIDEDTITSISSIIGVSAAASFNTWMTKNRLPSAEKVLTDWQKVKKTLGGLQLHELGKLTESIFMFLCSCQEDKEKMSGLLDGLETYAQFLYDLPVKGKEKVNKSVDAFFVFYDTLGSDKYTEIFRYVLNHKDQNGKSKIAELSRKAMKGEINNGN